MLGEGEGGRRGGWGVSHYVDKIIGYLMMMLDYKGGRGGSKILEKSYYVICEHSLNINSLQSLWSNQTMVAQPQEWYCYFEKHFWERKYNKGTKTMIHLNY